MTNENDGKYYCPETLFDDSNFCVTGWCNEGYTGIYCADCIEGWAHSNDKCVMCSNNDSYYVISVLIMLAAIIFIVYTINKALNVKKKDQIITENDCNKTSILIKILTNYFQMISIITSFKFKWSKESKTMFEGQNEVANSNAQIFNFDCVLKSFNFGFSGFFVKLSMIAITPFISFVIIEFVWFIIFLKRYGKSIFSKGRLLNNNVTTSIIVFMFMIHTTIVQTSILSFRCGNLGNESEWNYYLEEDYQIRCWESEHLKWLFIFGIPSLVVWGNKTFI